MFDAMFLGSSRCGCRRPKEKNGEGEGRHSRQRQVHGGIDKHFLPPAATGTRREKCSPISTRQSLALPSELLSRARPYSRSPSFTRLLLATSLDWIRRPPTP